MKIDRKEVWLMFDKHCCYCGNPLKDESGKHMHVEHMLPIKKLTKIKMACELGRI